MTRALILTPWHHDSEGYRPLFAVAYPNVSWQDETGDHPPSPDAYTISAVLDADTLAAVEADARFNVLHVEELADE